MKLLGLCIILYYMKLSDGNGLSELISEMEHFIPKNSARGQFNISKMDPNI